MPPSLPPRAPPIPPDMRSLIAIGEAAFVVSFAASVGLAFWVVRAVRPKRSEPDDEEASGFVRRGGLVSTAEDLELPGALEGTAGDDGSDGGVDEREI